MKYASITLTIFVIWIAVVTIAALVDNTAQRFQLFLSLVVFTLILFMIGFGKVK